MAREHMEDNASDVHDVTSVMAGGRGALTCLVLQLPCPGRYLQEGLGISPEISQLLGLRHFSETSISTFKD